MKHVSKIHILVVLALLLAACGGPAETATPTSDASLVLTAAAQTAESFRQSTLAAATPVPPSPTPEPSATATIAVVASPTLEASATLALPSNTPAAGAPALRAEFLEDVTVKDGTPFTAGQTFTKTWRLKNTGTQTWTTGYNLAFLNGERMNAPELVPLPFDVPPGATVDLSASMTAPSELGTHIGYWMLRDPNGKLFGIGDQGQWAFYVEIVTVGITGTPAASATPTVTAGSSATTAPSATPTATQAPLLSNVSLVVDASEANTCPHTFNFTGQFTTNRSATVTYQLEMTTDVSVSLPSPVTASLDAGTHTALYQITFTSAATGTAVFRITSPENASSSAVAFTLTCP